MKVIGRQQQCAGRGELGQAVVESGEVAEQQHQDGVAEYAKQADGEEARQRTEHRATVAESLPAMPQVGSQSPAACSVAAATAAPTAKPSTRRVSTR